MRSGANSLITLALTCAVSGCFRPPGPRDVDAIDVPRYAGLVGRTDYIERGFYLYWDSQKNYAFLDGGDVHMPGVTKLMTVNGPAEVKIEQVLFEVYKDGKLPKIVVSFKNPADGSEVRGRVSPVYLKYASKSLEVFPRFSPADAPEMK
jgi:hypothetical protein